MTISIITPSFNQGSFIERTIRSVLDQSIEAIEYVIMDGGSTDNTLAILKTYSNSLQWVSEADNGQAHAVNKGIQHTHGEIIGWLNSDDLYYPEALARVVEFFYQNPDIDVVYGMADHIDVQDCPYEAYPTETWNFDRLFDTCFICQPALFFRRTVVEAHGLLDDSLQYCMDYAYWLKLGRAGVRFGYLPEKLAGSRMYTDNKTLSARIQVHREINDMFKKDFGVVPNKWLMNYAHAVVEHHTERKKNPVKFLLWLSAHTIQSELRWNGRISIHVAKAVFGWFKLALKTNL